MGCVVFDFSGNCGEPVELYVPEGYHKQLSSLREGEWDKIDDFLSSVDLEFPNNTPLTLYALLLAVQRQVSRSPLYARLVIEISKDSVSYIKMNLDARIATLDGKSISEAELRKRLKKMTLSRVLEIAVSERHLNILFFKDTILLSNYMTNI